MVYFLKNENYSTKAFEKYLDNIAPYGRVKCLRTDNGGEFTWQEFKNVLIKNRIKHQITAPYLPHQK